MTKPRKDEDSFFGARITRRDFLNGAPVGIGGALLACRSDARPRADTAKSPSWALPSDWYGYGGVGDFRRSQGNTPEVVETAHRLRDGDFAPSFDRVESTEEYDPLDPDRPTILSFYTPFHHPGSPPSSR